MRRAFSLIELSIVLVILGLLVGGVLAGQSLIEAAELRRFTNELQQVSTAIATFQVKHNCLPGDCPDLASRFMGVENGDGNGRINDYLYASWYISGRPLLYETTDAFSVLGQSELLPKTYDASSIVAGTGYPMAFKNRGGYGVYWYEKRHYYRTGITTAHAPGSGGGSVSATFTFTPSEAAAISNKIGDGKPSGSVKVVGYAWFGIFDWTSTTDLGNYASLIGPLGANNAYCYSASDDAFNAAYTAPICNLAIPAAF